MRDLTGAPGIFKENKNANDTFNYLMDCEKKKYLMTCSSNQTPSLGIEHKDKSGIISSHAYAILDVRKLSNGAQLLNIRNPWGTGEWTGAWSDKSSKWTPKLKKEVGFKDSDDGSFWMEAKDFIKKFSEIGVCKVHDGYQYNSVQFDNIPTSESSST